MKKLRAVWKRYKNHIIIEIVVIVVMVVTIGIMYKFARDTEELRISRIQERMFYYDGFKYDDTHTVDEIIVDLYKDVLYQEYEVSHLKRMPYAVHWTFYNNEKEQTVALAEGDTNDYVLVWEGLSADRYNEIEEKVWMFKEYFSETEINAFKEICEKYNYNVSVNEVIGYYDNSGKLIPVEIACEFNQGEDDSFCYNIKNSENIDKEGIEYKTISGLTYIGEGEEKRVSETDYFYILRRKTLDSVVEKLDNALGVLEEGHHVENLDDWRYVYASYHLHSAGWKYDEEGLLSNLEIVFCADLHYMTMHNERFENAVIFVVAFTQITGLILMYFIYKNEKQRRYLDSMKYNFINAIAHEMKTPTAVIMNSVECIKEGIHPEKKDVYIDKVEKESMHINRLLMDMLMYAKVSDEERKLTKEEIDMLKLMEEVVEHFEDTIEKNNIDLQWDIKDNNIVVADRNLMEMVIDNYVSNAVKYCKGIIKITINKYSISVYNNGESIEPDMLQAIWEPLFVVDKSRKKREGSSGMGLAISAKIMDLHGMKYGAVNSRYGVEFYINM